MARSKEKTQEQDTPDLSIIELLLFDHQCLKRCIKVLADHNALKSKKRALAKEFLDCLHKHTSAERKAVYEPLLNNEEMHFTILEAQIEHEMISQKAGGLKTRLNRIRSLDDETEAELKVLADLVRNHLREEESEMLPKLQQAVDDLSLKEMGVEFLRFRKLTSNELIDYPVLKDELMNWQISVQNDSNQFRNRTERYMDSIKT